LRQGKNTGRRAGRGLLRLRRVGAFGKEAYILTGYFNLPKVLELALHDGVDPRSGKRLGLATGKGRRSAASMRSNAAFEAQLRHAIDGEDCGQRAGGPHVRAPDARPVSCP